MNQCFVRKIGNWSNVKCRPWHLRYQLWVRFIFSIVIIIAPNTHLVSLASNQEALKDEGRENKHILLDKHIIYAFLCCIIHAIQKRKRVKVKCKVLFVRGSSGSVWNGTYSGLLLMWSNQHIKKTNPFISLENKKYKVNKLEPVHHQTANLTKNDGMSGLLVVSSSNEETKKPDKPTSSSCNPLSHFKSLQVRPIFFMLPFPILCFL